MHTICLPISFCYVNNFNIRHRVKMMNIPIGLCVPSLVTFFYVQIYFRSPYPQCHSINLSSLADTLHTTKFNIEKYRQFRYKRNNDVFPCYTYHCCCGKAISIWYSECVSVALVNQRVESMRRSTLSSVAFFPHYLINGMIFEKKWFNIKCVFWFSLQFLPVTFLTLIRIEQDIVINVYRYPSTYYSRRI